MINLKKYLTYGGVSLAFLFSSIVQAKTTIDVMALYSPAVTSSYGGKTEAETSIQHMINVANGIYSDSPPSEVELRLVHIQESSLLNDGATTSNVLDDSARNSTIQALRDEYGADIVALYRPYRRAELGLCGTAYLVGLAGSYYASGAYAHISLGGICPSYVSAHELGHVQGLSHSHRQDDLYNGTTDAHLPYALGHGVDNNFVTVMAYEELFNAWKTVYKHSSPDLDCNGFPCGVALGEPGQANAVLALTQFSRNVANYRESKVVDGTTNNETGGETDDSSTSVTDLEEAKQLFEEAKAAFLLVKEEYLALRDFFRNKRDSLSIANANYRAIRSAYRNGEATKSALDEALAVRNMAREEKNTARADLIDYRNTTYASVRQSYLDARNNYRQLQAAN